MSEATAAVAPGELLRVEGVRKAFHTGEGEIEVLRRVDLVVHEGERLAILGQSGVGKSTLLHLLGTLDHPRRAACGFAARTCLRSRPTNSPAFATNASVSSSSFIICCPSSMPRRT